MKLSELRQAIELADQLITVISEIDRGLVYREMVTRIDSVKSLLEKHLNTAECLELATRSRENES